MGSPVTPPLGHVLLVDDDETCAMIVEAQLVRLGYTTSVAHSAPAAMEVIRQNRGAAFEAVISDYWMPGGNGVDLLRMLHGHDPTLALILLTSENGAAMLSDALHEGAQGYLEKPVNKEKLAEHAARAVAATREKRRLLDAAKAAQEIGRSQLTLLRYQSAKLGERLQVHYQPLNSASGDFVSVFTLDDQNCVLLASDASGHDMKAAYQSSYFHGFARGMLAQGGSIAEVFQFTNDMLMRSLNAAHTELSLAAIAIKADLGNSRFYCLNAGFPHPYLVDSTGLANALVIEPSNPLGWFPLGGTPQLYPAPVGHVVLWSDGLDDLAERLRVDPLSLACRLCHAEEDRAKLTLQAEDDIIVLRASLGVQTSVRDQPFAILSREYAGSQLAEIDTIQEFCEKSIRTAVPDACEDKMSAVVICLREALINALKHGCHGSAEQTARVQAAYDARRRIFRLRISDHGPGHNFDLVAHEAVAADQLLTEHRGLVLLKSLPASTYFSGRGSIVTMEFDL